MWRTWSFKVCAGLIISVIAAAFDPTYAPTVYRYLYSIVFQPNDSISTQPHSNAYKHCAPQITRQPIPSITLPTISHPSSNELALLVHHSRTPLLFRGDVRKAFRWTAAAKWSGEYFVQAAEAGVGPEEFLIKRSTTRAVKFANLRMERPYMRTKQQNADSKRQQKKQQQLHKSNHAWPQMPEFSMPFTSHNVSVREFFNELTAETPASASVSNSTFPYFADGISVLGQFLARDVLPLDGICPHPSHEITRCDMSLWIGKGGVVAAPHYDSSSNLFVQIKGRKQFTLAAPSATRCGMGLYPSLHPFYRQAQLDWMNQPEDTKPDIQHTFIPRTNGNADASNINSETCCELELFESTLEEGDMLYIPPHWFHRVTSLSTPSFSINSWWHSFFPEGSAGDTNNAVGSNSEKKEDKETQSTFDILSTILQQPLPFESNWNRRQQLQVTSLFIRALFARVEQEFFADQTSSAQPFLANELVLTRYHPFFASASSPSTTQVLTKEWCTNRLELDGRRSVKGSELYGCLDSTGEMNALLPKEFQLTKAQLAELTSTSSLSNRFHAQFGDYFRPYLDRLVSIYRQSHADQEWIRIHLHNYVEEIVWYSIEGNIDELYPYLVCCIAN